MTEVTEPVDSLLTTKTLLTLLTTTKVHDDLEILFLENNSRPILVDLLGLTVHQELQSGAAIHRLEADASPLRHNSARSNTLSVSDCTKNATPVCVTTVQSRLDERRPSNGRSDQASGFVVGGVLHTDGHELGGTFAVADDELGERLSEGGQDVLHGGVVVRGGGADREAACGTVGEDGDGVVSASVTVDGDGVEGPGDSVLEEGLQGRGFNGCVGAKYAQEGGHVRVDHTGSFGHTGEVVGTAGGGREGEGLGEELGEGIGCADGAGSGEPGIVGGGKGGVGGWDLVQDLGDGKAVEGWFVRSGVDVVIVGGSDAYR